MFAVLLSTWHLSLSHTHTAYTSLTHPSCTVHLSHMVPSLAHMVPLSRSQGCTDSKSTNYNSKATQDDGTRDPFTHLPYPRPTYNPFFTLLYPILTPSSPTLLIPSPLPTGTCDPAFYGCTDPTATNYAAAYTHDDGCAHARQAQTRALATHTLKSVLWSLLPAYPTPWRGGPCGPLFTSDSPPTLGPSRIEQRARTPRVSTRPTPTTTRRPLLSHRAHVRMGDAACPKQASRSMLYME